MFGWLSKKGTNAKVSMCIKEHKWFLEKADPTTRAKIFATAQLQLSKMGSLKNVVNSPFSYERQELEALYNSLETIRNNNQHQANVLSKNLQREGFEVPPSMAEYANIFYRAIEVWMVIAGMGIVPERSTDVKHIWTLFQTSCEHLPAAFAQLQAIDDESNIMGDSEDQFLFLGQDEDEWAEHCQFTPSVFIQ